MFARSTKFQTWNSNWETVAQPKLAHGFLLRFSALNCLQTLIVASSNFPIKDSFEIGRINLVTRKAPPWGIGHIACFWVVYFGKTWSKKVTQNWETIQSNPVIPFTARLGLERDHRIVCFDELCSWIDFVTLYFVKRVKSWNTMLGNQESQEPQDQLGSQLEPDQEVAAVLGTGE